MRSARTSLAGRPDNESASAGTAATAAIATTAAVATSSPARLPPKSPASRAMAVRRIHARAHQRAGLGARTIFHPSMRRRSCAPASPPSTVFAIAGARPGDVVAVVGIGGLGHLAVQFAAKMGCKTVAIARGKDEEPLARQLGAHYYIDNKTQDPAAELQKLGGAKVILATVTSADAMKAVLGGLGVHGKLMVIGAVPSLEVNTLQMLLSINPSTAGTRARPSIPRTRSISACFPASGP